MITRLIIRNFKRFREVEIDLGNPVVFVGPNNSGKTSAIQALTLWEIGLKRWNEKYKGKPAPERRPGVTVNRRDLFAIPHPNARHFWRDMQVRNVQRAQGKQQTSNVRIDIVVNGESSEGTWQCGLEFDFANAESFYCRPLRLEDGKSPKRMAIPTEAESVRVAFLPPMSGLAANEFRLDPGAVNVRIGEGRTAEVLRNLCYRVWEDNPDLWNQIVNQINRHFGVLLNSPTYLPDRGEIVMGYRERSSEFDLSSSGRGLQQTLLILAYMYANPNSVILLDEPDAHLEILRQRQMYSLMVEVASTSSSQIIAATHSEVLLNEAAEKDTVIAFVGNPHRIGRRFSQLRKALTNIGFEQYYLAEQTGWVLYLEGTTDLDILKAFAKKMGHDRASRALETPFLYTVGNQPNKAAEHFHGLREAFLPLKGIAIFDRLPGQLPDKQSFEHLVWKKREIENYLCTASMLKAYAVASDNVQGPLFAGAGTGAMDKALGRVGKAMALYGKGSPWDPDTKVSDDFLTPLFKEYYDILGLPKVMMKRNFHELVQYLPEDEIDPEVTRMLDAIARVAESASPATGEESF